MGEMLGRDRELSAVLGGLKDPEIDLTLVLGEAGIGKSRLLAELAAATPRRLTLVGSCLPMRGVLPLLPVIDAFDTRRIAGRAALTKAVRSLPPSLRPHVAGVMPRTLPEEVEPAPEVRRDLLFLAAGAVLAEVADTTPVTLVVEDVHWADPETLDLLTFLAGSRQGDVSLVASCRADENEMPEHVTQWLGVHRRSTGVQEVRLRPLSLEDVRRLVIALSSSTGARGSRVPDTLVARAEGNPFFVEQLVASAAEGDRVPRRLAELLLSRLRGVSDSAQATATALAVLGRPVPVTALALALLDEPSCLAAVRELDAASLLAREVAGVRLRHALLAEALLDELPGLAADHHRRLAAALQSLDDPSTSPEVADHLRLAGDETAELPVALTAAQRSWDVGAYGDAARWYGRVHVLHSRHPEQPLDLPEPELVRRWIRALDLSGARREATVHAERALEDFEEWPDLEERLSLSTYAAHLVSVEDQERGARLFEELLPLYDGLPASGGHAYLLDRLSSMRLSRGDSRAALSLAARGREVARTAGDLPREAHALARMSLCYRRLGERREADHTAAEAIRVAERSGDSQALLDPLINESDHRLKCTEYDRAVAVGQRGIEIAEGAGLQHSFEAQILLANMAEAYLALGRTDDAGRIVDPLAERPLRPDDDLFAALRAQVDLRRGDVEGALDRLRRGPGTTVQDSESFRQEAEALASLLLWAHQPQQALDLVMHVLPGVSGGDRGQEVGLLLCLGARAVADDQDVSDPRRGDLAGLDGLLGSSDQDPFSERATFRRGAADGGQWRAERARAEGRSAPELWAEAASAWEVLTMPHDAAYCWWRAAEALLAADGEPGDVRSAVHAAYRLAAEHLPLRAEVVHLAASARIPVLDASEVDDSPARSRGLTAQETKVLRLLSGGLTNGEIATALFISPKTVSVHVSNVLRKLEVGNRTEAAAWALRQGLVTDT